MIPRQCGSHVGGTGCPRSYAFRELGFHRRTSRTNCRQLGSDQIARLSRIAVVTSPLHSSYERGCQEKKLLPAPGEDAGVVTYIQPHLILRGVIGLAALARRTF